MDILAPFCYNVYSCEPENIFASQPSMHFITSYCVGHRTEQYIYVIKSLIN